MRGPLYTLDQEGQARVSSTSGLIDPARSRASRRADRRRLLVASALALVFALVPLAFTPEQAHAATISPDAPPPVNVLPSVVKGGAGALTGTAYQNYLATVIYRFGKSLTQSKAIQAVNAGAASMAEIATVDAVKAGYRVPVTKLAALGKVAGGVGVVVTGYQIGAMMGNGAVQLTGLDTNGAVCRQDGAEFLGLLTGVDCAAYELAQTYAPNADVTVGAVGSEVCGPNTASGYCLTYVSTVGFRLLAGSANASALWYLVDISGTVTAKPSTLTITSCADTLLYGSSTSYCVNTTPNTSGSANAPAGSLCSSGNVPAGKACLTWSWGVVPSGTTAPSPIPTLTGIRMTNSGGSTGDIPPTTTPDSDPARTLRCVIVGSNGTSYSASTGSFHETDPVLPSPVCPDLPAGVLMDTMTIFEDSPMGSVELWTESTTPEYDASQALAPECSEGTCLLDLRKSAVSCFSSPDGCAEWFADPDKATTYTCHYGTHAVDLDECNVYAPSFNPEARSTGDVYGDPETGDPITAPPGSLPGIDKGTFGSPSQDPTAERECFPSGWGVLNPVEWVVRPVQCALEWAFVPRESVVQAKMQEVTDTWADTPPAKVAAMVSGYAFVAPPSGCNGITVDVWFLGPPFQIMDACPGSMLEDMAYWARVFGNVGFTIYGLIAITRNLARIVEFPGVGEA